MIAVLIGAAVMVWAVRAITDADESLPTASPSPQRADVDALPEDPFATSRSEPVTGIVNAHEHIMNSQQIPKFLEAMNKVGVSKTVVLGSPRYTYYLGTAGFTDYDENNEEVLAMSRKYPDRLVPFVVIHPDDEDAPAKLVRYLDQGAKGVKLFSGHGGEDGQGVPFHTMPLDDPRLEAIYRIVEDREVPLMFHVNYNRFQEEFERVLSKHRRMKVVCPHFCLTLSYQSRLRRLLSSFPNLWTDVSFGYVTFQAEGYDRMSSKPRSIRKLIEDFPDRFLFGTDLVITDAGRKTAEWISINTAVYRDMLEQSKYTFYALKGQQLNGLNLSPSLLRRIYKQNSEEWLESPPKPVGR